MKKASFFLAILLVLQANLFGQIKSSVSNSERIKFIFSTNVSDFFSQLNALGKEGYRLGKVTKIPLVEYEDNGTNDSGQTKYLVKETKIGLAAVVGFEGKNYQYAWLEEMSLPRISDEIGKFGKDGFSLIKTLPIWGEKTSKLFGKQVTVAKICKVNADINTSDSGNSSNFFLLEKDLSASGAETKYQVIFDEKNTSFFGEWKKQSRENISKRIETASSEGFRPVFLSATSPFFAILGNQNKIQEGKFNLTANRKEIETLAKDNFTPIIFNQSVVLLSKETRQTPNSYRFVSPVWSKKKYLSEINELYANGWRYKSVGLEKSTNEFCEYGFTESTLLFEQNIAEPNKYEHSVIKLNDATYFKNDKFVMPALDSEAISKVRSLVENGYIIRDLFYADGVNIILDKPKN